MTSGNECQEIRLAAMALADGESPALDSRQIGEHLEICEPCRNLVRQEQQRLIPETARRALAVADLWPAIESRLSRDRAEPGPNRAARATRWRASWVIGLAASACLLLVVAGSLWMSLGRNAFRDTIGKRGSPEASSTPSPDVTVWDPPEHVDPDEFRERFAFYFEPEFQQAQAKRIGLDVNVDLLHSVSIPGKDGALGTLFIDRTGVVMLAVRYPLVDQFHDGLAAVGTVTDWKNGNRITNYGFIDRTGKLAIAPEYDYADRFSEGLAAVHKKNKWGYIDRKGKVIVALRGRFGEQFRDGVACLWLEDNTGEFIDQTGKVRFTINRHDVGRFSEGLLCVNLPGTQGIDSGRARGYVDRKFEFVFRLGEDSSGFWPLRCEEFHDGMAAVEVEGSNQWGFITREGKLTIPGPYIQVQPFSEGVAAVTREKGPYPKWGYIDREGKTIIEPRFLAAGSFAEGLAPVLIPLEDKTVAGLPRGKWGYVDREGRTIIEPRFHSAGAFENGLARVSENPFHVGFIDKTGVYVWQFTESAFGLGNSNPNR